MAVRLAALRLLAVRLVAVRQHHRLRGNSMKVSVNDFGQVSVNDSVRYEERKRERIIID